MINGVQVDSANITYSHETIEGAARAGQIRVALPEGGLTAEDIVEYVLYPSYDSTADIKYTFKQEPVIGYYSASVPADGYSVIIRQSGGGTLSVDKAKAIPGDTVTITATPDPYGALIRGSLKVNGGAVAVSEEGKFIMPNESVVVTAEFEREMHSINIAQYDNGLIKANQVRGGEGDEIALTLTANTGFAYVEGSLKINGGEIDLTLDNKFIMPNAPVTITAQFERLYNVTTNAVNGVIAVDKVRAIAGEIVKVSLKADDGYKYVNGSLKVDNGAVAVMADNTFVMPNKNVVITVHFREIGEVLSPTVNWPSELEAVYGQTLEDIALPVDNGTGTPGTFSWKDGTISVGSIGTNYFELIFTPTDEAYSIEKQDIKVVVSSGIEITSVTSGNGQSDVNFAIVSANGKGYKVFLANSKDGTFTEYSKVNYNAKGAHIKGLTNGKIYYAYIEYTDAEGSSIRSNTIEIRPGK